MSIRHNLKRGVWSFLVCVAILSVFLPARAAIDPHLFVVTSDFMRGNSASLELDSPWGAEVEVEGVGTQATVRHFFDRHYVVNSSSGDVQVINPANLDTILTFSVGPGSRPQDILLVDPQTAYVSRYDSTLLYKVNPATGDLLNVIDLALFADADGLPEMAMMALDRNHLFVQIQRVDRTQNGSVVPPSYLAVIDVTSDELVDVGSKKGGLPGITLNGTVPRFKMHRDAVARRLFVSAPGLALDVSGGIEEIDLDQLTSLGFILPEPESIGDLGPFVMVSPDRGYAVGHTDLIQSSHLFMFVRDRGRVTSEIYLTFAEIRSMAYDPVNSLLFFPDPASFPPGIEIIDTTTNTLLVASPVPTGLPPHDLVVTRPSTVGEAMDLRVEGFDASTGELSISYRPACLAADHDIVWGPLQNPGEYSYSGQDCGIGSSGSYGQLDPGAGSFFFVVVGAIQTGVQGSYGTNCEGVERPQDLDPPVCSFQQDLSFTCDIW